MAAAGRVAGGLVGHLYDLGGLALHAADGFECQGQELGIHHQHLRAAVIEDIGDRIGIEAGVDGVEHRARGRHAVMGHGLGGDVGHDGGDDIAGLYPAPGESRGHAGGIGPEIGVCEAGIAIDHRLAIGPDQGRAPQGRKRRERHVIGGAFLKPGFISHPAHVIPPVFPDGVVFRCTGGLALGA